MCGAAWAARPADEPPLQLQLHVPVHWGPGSLYSSELCLQLG